MCKIVVLGQAQQLAEALGTQFGHVTVLINDNAFIRNKDEMISNERVTYKKYAAKNVIQEILILRNLLNNMSPDVIYINGFRHLWIVGFLVREPGLLPRKPILLVTSHNSWAWQKASKRYMMALLCKLFADGIFPLASFQENWLIKLGISPLRMRMIPNAVDINQFSPEGTRDFFIDISPENTNPPIIVNVANIHQTKGQDVLIKAICLVKKEICNIRLVLIGNNSPNSPYDKYLNELIAEFDLETNVVILGNIDHIQIPRVLRSSDIVTISSWNEVCPNILLESFSVGKVAISTAVGGIPDIINNEINGFLVDPGHVEGFADCIFKVLNNPSLKISIEKKARISAIDNFSYDVIGREHKDFLTSINQHKNYSVFN